MKLHIITIGQPKLTYAKLGWEEYLKRLSHYHQVRITHIADKHNDAAHLLSAIGTSYKVALADTGHQFSSPELASFLETHRLEGREMSLLIGGPEGLPASILDTADFVWSFGRLTFPHDMAMVILVESLYRASTILAGQPYHK